MPSSIDINGSPVAVGSTVRLPSLSGQWLEDLPAEERSDVMSMVGEIFVVEEIDDYGHPWVRKSWPGYSTQRRASGNDDYGHPWVRKSWPNEAEGKGHSHSVALEQHEMEVVQSAL